MLNFGFGEIFIVIVLALVFVGPERLPHAVRWLGRQYGKLMRASEELRRAFVLEADRMDAEQRTEDLRRRREEARQRAEEARRAREEGREPPPGSPELPEDAATRPGPVAVEPPDAGDAAAAALAERGLAPAGDSSPPVHEAPLNRELPEDDLPVEQQRSPRRSSREPDEASS